MNKYIKNDKLGEGYYRIEHPSGLTILLYPMEEYSSAFTMLSVKFGAADTNFEIDGNKYRVPMGTAHFLEHKALSSNDEDAFAVMSAYGADANAFTSMERTAFYYSCVHHAQECLETMLKQIQLCSYTEESIDREREIISREIKMSEDECDWLCYQNLLKAMYHDPVISAEIAGNISEIKKIKSSTLKLCHKYFYNPHNMILVSAGNIDCDNIIKTVDKTFKKTDYAPVKRIYFDEPQNIKYKYTEISQTLSAPIFNIGFKMYNPKSDDIKNVIIDELLLEIIAGDATEFYKYMYDEGLINSTFSGDTYNCRGLSALVFEGESRNPEKVRDLICSRVEYLQQNGIDKEEFYGYVKSSYGKYLSVFSSAEAIVNALLFFEKTGGCIYDVPEILSRITVKDAEERLKNCICADNTVLSVINLKQEEK